MRRAVILLSAVAAAALLLGCAVQTPAVVEVEQVMTARVAEAEKRVISVMMFDDRSIDTDKFEPWKLGIPDMIMEALGAIPYYRVISREYLVKKVLDEQQFQMAGVTDAETAVRVGRLLNAQFIVVGSFQVFRESLQINAKVMTVESGEIVAQANSQGTLDGFYTVQNDVAIKITEAFSLDIPDDAKQKLRQRFDTTAVDASLANYKGEEKLEQVQALERQRRAPEAAAAKEEAKRAFEAALEIDGDYQKAKQNLAKLSLAIPMTL